MTRKVKYAVILLLVVFLLFTLIEISGYYYGKKRVVKKIYPIPSMYQRVLIIAPHPDDETLAAGGLIQDVVKFGGEVKVVVMTNGDSFKRAVVENYGIFDPTPQDFLRLGYERQKETLSALKYLGVKKENIIFLGYPDKGLAALWWQNFEKPLLSYGTKKTCSPYVNSYSKCAKHIGKNVLKDLKSIIEGYNPTLVVYPHPNELHPDHWATNSFVKYTLYTLKKDQIPQFLYIVHRNDWPLPLLKQPHLNLNPPP
ncbi:MAG: PIG-L deacetylase family protein, partial [Caldanaerobacter sp.]